MYCKLDFTPIFLFLFGKLCINNNKNSYIKHKHREATTEQIIDEIKIPKLSAWSSDHKPFGKLFFAAVKLEKKKYVY